MSAEDELAIPEVPEAKPEDLEDVSWALSTAEAMWARGDHLEGIKWVRKAAEAASDAEDDARALHLAKAASDLANLIARRSRASILEDGPTHAGGGQPNSGHPNSGQPNSGQPNSGHPHSGHPASHHPASNHPASVPPNTARMPGSPSAPLSAQGTGTQPPAAAGASDQGQPSSGNGAAPVASSAMPVIPQAPPLPSAGAPSGVTSVARPVALGKSGSTPRSMPPAPIPLPSRASNPPKAAAPAAAVPPRAAPRPLNTSDARQGREVGMAGRGILSNRTADAVPKSTRGKRRSRENLDAEAKAAGTLDTAPQTAVSSEGADRVLSRGNDMNDVTAVGDGGGAVEVPFANARVKRARISSRPEPDPRIESRVGNLDELLQREKSAEEWDASPTQNLTGDDMDHMNEGDRKTTAFQAPIVKSQPPPARAPSLTVHDPEIQTSQAVRVVVWRDGTGVHIAPAGTVVQAMTIDAVLVVLEPSADLTAWLSQRDR